MDEDFKTCCSPTPTSVKLHQAVLLTSVYCSFLIGSCVKKNRITLSLHFNWSTWESLLGYQVLLVYRVTINTDTHTVNKAKLFSISFNIQTQILFESNIDLLTYYLLLFLYCNFSCRKMLCF